VALPRAGASAVAVACGADHTLVLCRSEALWWGACVGPRGQVMRRSATPRPLCSGTAQRAQRGACEAPDVDVLQIAAGAWPLLARTLRRSAECDPHRDEQGRITHFACPCSEAARSHCHPGCEDVREQFPVTPVVSEFPALHAKSSAVRDVMMYTILAIQTGQSVRLERKTVKSRCQ